jgi:hypothetical protein
VVLTASLLARARWSIRRLAVLATVGLVAATGTGCAASITHSPHLKGSNVSEQVQSAEFYRDQAIQLITDIAAAVAPGSKLALVSGSPGLSAYCTAPLTGLVYYNVGRDFDAPGGASGASLIPAIIPLLHSHGYRTGRQGQTAGWASVPAQTDYVGLRVMGNPHGPTVRITIDTRCGTPQPVGGAPSTPSPTPPPTSASPNPYT